MPREDSCSLLASCHVDSSALNKARWHAWHRNSSLRHTNHVHARVHRAGPTGLQHVFAAAARPPAETPLRLAHPWHAVLGLLYGPGAGRCAATR